MATIRLESVVTSQTASQTLGYYKVYVEGNPSSTTENGIIPMLMWQRIVSGGYSPNITYPAKYPSTYIDTYKNESELYLYPDQVGYDTSSVGTYNLEEYGVAWEEGTLDVLATSMRSQYASYFQTGYYGSAYAKDYFTNFYVYSTPQLSTPIGLSATNVTSNSARLTWREVENAADYDVAVRTHGSSVWCNLKNGESELPSQIPSYIRIKESPYYSNTIEWEAVDGAIAYEVEINHSPAYGAHA